MELRKGFHRKNAQPKDFWASCVAGKVSWGTGRCTKAKLIGRNFL